MAVLEKHRTAPDTIPTSYQADPYTWALTQAAHLRAGDFTNLDIENLAEEILDVARREYDKLESALTILLLHMLKWDFQSARRSRSWVFSIAEHRRRVLRQLDDNPGLKSMVGKAQTRAFESARIRAAFETKLEESVFPAACPYDWDEMMQRTFALAPASR